MLKKTNKFFIIFLFINFIYCSFSKKDNLLEPKQFLDELERVIEKYYYFENSISINHYLDAIKILEPTIANVSTHNAKEYFIEYLRKNSEKPIEEREAIYKKATYFLLKNMQGRNLFLPPSVIRIQQEKENSAGIGIILFEEAMGRILIIDVLEGSPAYVAEIKPNQYLQAIDGISVDNLFLEEVIAKIKGKPKTSLHLTIQGINFSLYRSNLSIIPIRKALWNINQKKILYLQIRFLTSDIEETIKQELFNASNIDYLVLDLRYVSTGNIEEIYKVSDLFLPKKKVFKIHIKNEKPIEFITSDNIFYTGKLIVLVQEKSSPFAFALAKILESSEKVIVIGTDVDIPVYIGNQIELEKNNQNYGAFYVTSGFVEFFDTYNKKNKALIKTYVPNYPPGSEPNRDDVFHKRILELIER